jgi:hypothetical protein
MIILCRKHPDGKIPIYFFSIQVHVRLTSVKIPSSLFFFLSLRTHDSAVVFAGECWRSPDASVTERRCERAHWIPPTGMSPLRRRGAGMRVCVSANLKTPMPRQAGELCAAAEWGARPGCHHGARRLGVADLERRAADWPSEPAGPRAGGSRRPQGVSRP